MRDRTKTNLTPLSFSWTIADGADGAMRGSHEPLREIPRRAVIVTLLT